MILDHERKALRQLISSMWAQRLDTAFMASALQLPEADIERELHAALEIRRAVNKLADGK
jgi:hypothetical protein